MSDVDDTPTTMDLVWEYARRGWHLIPLHSLDENGRCTCRKGEDKCPRRQWGKHPWHTKWTHVATNDGPTLHEWWDAEFPDANVGIATGPASGIWVLDIDPDDGGDSALADLLDEHGDLPTTRTHRTGSGGVHYFFIWPEHGEIPNTSKILGAGIDTRGTGGQVVAPPSVSGKGTYTVLDDTDPVPAPAWLLDRLAEIAERRRQGTDAAVVGAEPVDVAALPAHLRSRLIWDTTQPPADRSAHFHGLVASCRRAGLTQGQTVTVVADWCERSGKYTGRVAAEVARCWGKLTHIDDERREQDVSDLIAPSRSQPLPGQSRENAHGGAEADHGLTGNPVTDRLNQLRSLLLNTSDLDSIDPPAPLVENTLYRDTLAWLHGKPGSGKSFVALDWAGSVATGRDWHGRAVNEPGSVVYLIAEGKAGIRQRVRAWEKHAGQPMDNVHFLPVAVQMLSPTDRDAFISLVCELSPTLVVVDTQAKVTVGADENSSQDMGRFVQSADAIRESTGACVLLVHHEARAGDTLRGSTALEGAADTMVRVTKDRDTVRIDNPKQKDAPEFDPLLLRLVSDEDGGARLESQNSGGTPDELSPSDYRLMATFRDSFGTTGATSSQLKDAADMTRTTYYRSLNTLVMRGLLVNTGTKKRPFYCLPENAGPAAVPTSPKQSHGTASSQSQVPHPYRGGTDGTGTNPETPDSSAKALTGGRVPRLVVVDGRIIDADAHAVLERVGDDLIDPTTGEVRATVADLPGGAA